MTFLPTALTQLILLLIAIGCGGHALQQFHNTQQQCQSARRHEEQVAICSHIMANQANLRDASDFLVGAFPNHRQVLREARSELDAALQRQAREVGCPPQPQAALQAAIRRNLHPGLAAKWPNWVPTYALQGLFVLNNQDSFDAGGE